MLCLGAALLCLRCAASTGSSSTSVVEPASGPDASVADTGAINPHVDDAHSEATKADRSRVDAEGAADAFFGAARCPPNVMFCEDFERDTLDTANWSSMTSGAVAITIDTTRFARGTRSLHFKKQTLAPSFGYVGSKPSFGLTGSRLFVRYFMYVDAVMPDRWFWVFGAADAIPWVIDRIQAPRKEFSTSITLLDPARPGRAIYNPQSGMDGKSVNRLVPAGRWACWEFELRGDGAGETLLSIDDQPVPDFDITGWPAPDSPRIYFGIYSSHDDIIPKADGFNVWVDGIAVATHRIGCAD